MPTFTDPVADAAEMSEAMRALAHASRTFDQPEDMYGVLGDLLGSVRSLEQVLTQIATAHADSRGRAANDVGDRAIGTRDALDAAGELRRAAALIGQAERRLDAASAAAGRIAWHPTAEAPEQDAGRLINIVFLQGGEADRFLDLIDAGGADAAIQELAGYDYGEETVEAALENGYVYATPPLGPLDRSTSLDAYTLVYNLDHRHLGLYRTEDAFPSPTLLGLEDPCHATTTETPSPAATATLSSVADGPVLAQEMVRAQSRRERLGTPTIHRQQPGSHAMRSLGR